VNGLLTYKPESNQIGFRPDAHPAPPALSQTREITNHYRSCGVQPQVNLSEYDKWLNGLMA
jgi:hypothetical protein